MIQGRLQPRPQQQAEIDFLWSRKRAAVWSAPGKGKTLSAAYAIEQPATISCPTYLADKWARWLRENMPPEVADHVYMATGSKEDRWDRYETIAAAAEDPQRVLIISHNMLRPELEEYVSAGKPRKRAIHDSVQMPDGSRLMVRMEYPLPWTQTVIIDEAHWLRGHSAWQSKGAIWAFCNVERMYQLTATPVYKDADDVFMQLKILDPMNPEFASRQRWMRKHLRLWSDGWKEHVIGPKDAAAFVATLSQWGIRHDYVEGELPETMMLDPIVVEPDSFTKKRLMTLRRQYRDGVDTYATAIEALQQMDRLAASDHRKLAALVDWVADNAPRMDGSRRGVLVLCHYRETVDEVYAALRKADPRFEAVRITGDTPYERRASMVENSTNVVGTWGSMSEGIDASHLRLVVPYELDWTFGSEYQGIGRVVRPRMRPCSDGSPVMVQPIRLRFSGDMAKATKLQERSGNAREILMEACRGA